MKIIYLYPLLKSLITKDYLWDNVNSFSQRTKSSDGHNAMNRCQFDIENPDPKNNEVVLCLLYSQLRNYTNAE